MKFRPLLALLILATATLAAEKPVTPATPSPWGDFVEKDFPFFSSVLDARELGEGFPKDNLTPRGIILNLGHNLWACFDTDLLRIAAIWEGEAGKPPVSADALAPGSYHVAGQKTKDGQEYLPKPIGKVWLANGIYPGWQVGEKPNFVDPREPTPSPEEVGRGGIPYSNSLLLDTMAASFGQDLSLSYDIAGIRIQEQWTAHVDGSKKEIVRGIEIPAHEETLCLLLPFYVQTSPISEYPRLGYGHASTGKDDKFFSAYLKSASFISSSENKHNSFLKLPPLDSPLRLDISSTKEDSTKSPYHFFLFSFHEPSDDVKLKLRIVKGSTDTKDWRNKQETVAKLASSTKPDAYVIDEIPLPLDNPWKRNVRLADLAFLNDQGDAAGVTFDGDVWLISGLKGDLDKVTWKRFASGLHEPMSIVVRGSDILVFDRNGIWKLVDTNNDKECDRYEMFCNLFAQTAETREFPNSMKLGPKGELYISKGGQEGTTYGKHNGTVIKVAADGKSMEVIGYGLRQPFIGVNPKTGLVTASDQQGNYVPSTPLHIISDHHFYGHLPTIAPKEKYPETITEPLTWLPHPVNPSGVTQTWLIGAKMGPVNDELIHIGYNRPELFRVLMNSHFEKPQAAVVSFNRNFDFPTLNAVVNPADGQLYVVGFQVWGTVVKKISGLARVRYTDKPRVLIKEVTPTDKGLLLRFNAKLDAKLATDPDSFNGERWNYKRTFEYGSPHLKLDGSSGQEWMTASSAYLSKDGMSVLVGFPDMKAGVHQMRIGWGLKSADGLKAENTAYFSPWELMTFDAKKEGFDENLKVDLTPRKAAAVATVKATAEEGERLYQMFGCMACHSTDGTLVGKVGPSWKGLYGSEREIAKGQKGKFKADEAYLRESILTPSAKVVKGFEKFDTGMPIYSGILNDSQIESLILYIKSLK